MVQITDKAQCCGCSACASICIKHCISMTADEEGFLYPQINKEECIHCNACEKICPIANPVKEIQTGQKAYLIQHRDDGIRMDSSSGGAFTAVAEYVIQKGGVVFGAAYDHHFKVHHEYVETTHQLYKFRNSKYVQSEIGDCFRQVESFLQAGRLVCFSGTPCQIEGLSNFLRRKYDRLILIDVVCHGIPSPLIWNKYLEYHEICKKQVDNIRFRDKYYGYKYSTMSILQNGVNVYHAGVQADPMLRAFFSDMSDRPSCYHCMFKKRYRVSDMTIWDCFSVYDFDKAMDDDKGTTRVLCHTDHGSKVIHELGRTVNCLEVDPDKLVYGVKEMVESVHANPMRTQFFIDACRLDGAALFHKYYPINLKSRLQTAGRKILLISGRYGFVKRCLNRIKGR